MAESGSTKEEHFLKQRRNIMLFSVFMILIPAFKLEIKGGSFLGLTLEIHEFSHLVTFVLIFFFYFLWRYIIAFIENNCIREIKDAFRVNTIKSIRRAASAFICKGIDKGSNSIHSHNLIGHRWCKVTGDQLLLFDTKNSCICEKFENKNSLTVLPSNQENNNYYSRLQDINVGELDFSNVRTNNEHIVRMSHRKCMSKYLMSLIEVIFTSKYFVEYILPFFVANMALRYFTEYFSLFPY